jgi:hypothetical protein
MIPMAGMAGMAAKTLTFRHAIWHDIFNQWMGTKAVLIDINPQISINQAIANSF